MVTVEAAAMAKEIAATGHVALYGTSSITTRQTSSPISADHQRNCEAPQQDPTLTVHGWPHGQRRRI